MKSNCCNKDAVTVGNITLYYVCTNCNKACDIGGTNSLCHKLALLRDKGILTRVIDYIRYEILECYE